jgi:hypothetical protein
VGEKIIASAHHAAGQQPLRGLPQLVELVEGRPAVVAPGPSERRQNGLLCGDAPSCPLNNALQSLFTF